MAKLAWAIEVLNNNHQRMSFDCGEFPLNNYLHQLAGQHAKNNISRTFVGTSTDDPKKIIGFYSLSAGNINFNELPVKLQKKFPKYPIPVARIGRLAVDLSMQKQGIGEDLLMDALHRCNTIKEQIGIVGVVVDAKHEKAKNFYLKYGFNQLTDLPLTLFIPMHDISASII